MTESHATIYVHEIVCYLISWTLLFLQKLQSKWRRSLHGMIWEQIKYTLESKKKKNTRVSKRKFKYFSYEVGPLCHTLPSAFFPSFESILSLFASLFLF